MCCNYGALRLVPVITCTTLMHHNRRYHALASVHTFLVTIMHNKLTPGFELHYDSWEEGGVCGCGSQKAEGVVVITATPSPQSFVFRTDSFYCTVLPTALGSRIRLLGWKRLVYTYSLCLSSALKANLPPHNLMSAQR